MTDAMELPVKTDQPSSPKQESGSTQSDRFRLIKDVLADISSAVYSVLLLMDVKEIPQLQLSLSIHRCDFEKQINAILEHFTALPMPDVKISVGPDKETVPKRSPVADNSVLQELWESLPFLGEESSTNSVDDVQEPLELLQMSESIQITSRRKGRGRPAAKSTRPETATKPPKRTYKKSKKKSESEDIATEEEKSKNQAKKKRQCEECGAVVRSLADHMVKHTGIKKYVCPICSKAFARRANYYQHIRGMHNQEKRFVCDLCGYKCFTRRHFNIHSQIHSGERPYSCDECPKSFLTATKLKYHKRVHTGEKPFQCTVCDVKLACRENWANHLKSRHGIIVPKVKPRQKTLDEIASSENSLAS